MSLTSWLLRRKRRVVSAGVLMVALPLLALALAISLYLAGFVRDLIVEEGNSLAKLAAHTLDERLQISMDTGVRFSKRPALQLAIRAGNRLEIRNHLRHLVEIGGAIDRAFVATPQGVLFADFPEDPAVQGTDFSSRDWYRGVSRTWQPYVSEFYIRKAAPQRYLFAIAVPIKDDTSGEVLAILILQPSQDYIQNALGSIRIPTGHVYVVDAKGMRIYHSDEKTDREVDYSQVLPVQLLRQAKEGAVSVLDPLDKMPVIAMYHPVSNFGWGVVIDRHESEILRPVRNLAVWIAGFTLVFLGIGAFFAYQGAGLLASTDALAKKLQEEEADRRLYGEFLELLNAQYPSIEVLCRAALVKLGGICDLAAAACHIAEGEHLVPRAALAAALPGETGPFARECAREKRTRRLREIPPESLQQMQTAVGQILPREIVAVPLLSRGEAIGVIEAASLQGLTDRRLELLERLAAQLAIGVATLQGHLAQKSLAAEVQHANRELQEVNEEQAAMNEEVRQMNAELQNHQKALQEANLRLEEATRAKSDFLANMSHELRTPLNCIIGFADILDQGMQGELTREQSESVRDIGGSGRHLLDLINDILDLSKVEAGKMELDLQEVNIEDLVRDSLSFFKEKALKHRLSLTAEVAVGTGNIVADGRKVKQVLVNLLSNAVKFTPDGGRIRVLAHRVAADDGSPGGEFVEIVVEDTGIGISREDQKKLFQPFTQLQPTLTKEFAGTGLGLSLCRSMVELQGGGIRVESESGRGSTFIFKLPVAQAVHLVPPFRPAALRNVVVIEDDAVAVRAVEGALRSLTCAVHTAPDGERGLDLVRLVRPDLVVLDLGLPGISGFDVAAALKADPESASIPIVVLTAMDLTSEERRRLSEMVTVILRKGNLSGMQFLEAVRHATSKSV